jgi:hypothetical protein
MTELDGNLRNQGEAGSSLRDPGFDLGEIRAFFS